MPALDTTDTTAPGPDFWTDVSYNRRDTYNVAYSGSGYNGTVNFRITVSEEGPYPVHTIVYLKPEKKKDIQLEFDFFGEKQCQH